MPGSIGATDAARVFKGTKMGGQTGDAQVTIAGLKVVDIDSENNILYIKGAVPGARNGLLLVSAPGNMNLSVPEPEVKESASAEAPADKEVKEEKNEEKVEDQDHWEDQKQKSIHKAWLALATASARGRHGKSEIH